MRGLSYKDKVKIYHLANFIMQLNKQTTMANIQGLHRASTPPGMPPPEANRQPSKLSFGTVCSSNINRSMEAHVVLQNAGEIFDGV